MRYQQVIWELWRKEMFSCLYFLRTLSWLNYSHSKFAVLLCLCKSCACNVIFGSFHSYNTVLYCSKLASFRLKAKRLYILAAQSKCTSFILFSILRWIPSCSTQYSSYDTIPTLTGANVHDFFNFFLQKQFTHKPPNNFFWNNHLLLSCCTSAFC